MHNDLILKAAAQFGYGKATIHPMGDFMCCDLLQPDGSSVSIILQCVNARTIPLPENIIQNYLLLREFLQHQPEAIKIAELIPSHHQKLYWIDEEENFWMAFKFDEQYRHFATVSDDNMAYSTANTFARLTKVLGELDISTLSITIPGFHDLNIRFRQFEEAIDHGAVMRLLRATHVISELRQRKYLLRFYNSLSDENVYPTRVMHHDAKAGNLLFQADLSGLPIILNMNTIMPGKFFSGPGELIRNMVSPVDENSTAWEKITVSGDCYEAILNGYLDGAGSILTSVEKEMIHYSGLLVICMHCLRFVTDFLQNDVYFQTAYPEQNLNRALNQLILLEQLEEYLQLKNQFSAEV